ncbi:alpha-L-fucosidase [Massilia sp. METH4]|uniref:alpha-L-fucosidase n=1 Tax=Massilia sp. METH4 TaxID=3123041 RepID=UPI0030CB9869
MKRRTLLRHALAALPAGMLAARAARAGHAAAPGPNAAGPFSPDWQSLAQYRAPDWFRNAKFGIWAHWGPQCEPEFGDWYARLMYFQETDTYRHHVATYGHPSKVGFKDIIRRWKAARWNPDELVALYKRCGARYFMAMANHHDNFDLYDSRHQPQWNSVRMGPRKDIVGGWRRAAQAAGLPFGVSVHAAHAWTWLEASRNADRDGPLMGVQYDGKLKRTQGRGTWWDGLDPQALYEQDHPRSTDAGKLKAIWNQWNWNNGASIPSAAYCDKFYRRTIDLLDRYEPDMVYFDDTVLPLWPVSDVGLKIAAHMYNRSVARHGRVEAVINGKILDEEQRKCLVWDVERGQSGRIEPYPWQTCTCLGDWHYDRRIYQRKGYKSATTVIQTLADVVSKNGNLLLSVPVRADGTIDELERAIVEEIGRWLAVNGEAIYDSRPWAVFGEGPSVEGAAPLEGPGFNEGKNKPYTGSDLRFTTRAGHVYAFVMARPDADRIRIGSMGSSASHLARPVTKVEILGHGDAPSFVQAADALTVGLPARALEAGSPLVLKIA